MDSINRLKIGIIFWACLIVIVGIYSAGECREVTVEVEIGGAGHTKPAKKCSLTVTITDNPEASR